MPKACKQAVILAGGRGMRLRPLTNDRPKPMVSVHGRPFLEYLIELFKENDITDIVLLLGYMPEKIIDYFGDGARFGVNLKYSVGDLDWETGTRIREAKDLIADTFLLAYADNYWPMRLGLMMDFYNQGEAPYMVTAYNNRDGGAEYGYENNLQISENGPVLNYDRSRKAPGLSAVDIGFFILQKSILGFMPEHNFSFEAEILPKIIAQGKLAAYRTDHGYYPLTSPESLSKLEKFFAPRKVIFLDRDGIINKPIEGDYVRSPDQFKFLPDAVSFLRHLSEKNYEIYVITNQRGIGRGLMTEKDLENIHAKMTAELDRASVKISGIYHCPHLEEDKCFCRKPAPGLLHRAANENYINLYCSIFVGDRDSDVEAGNKAGCRTILVGPNENLLSAVEPILS